MVRPTVKKRQNVIDFNSAEKQMSNVFRKLHLPKTYYRRIRKPSYSYYHQIKGNRRR